MNARPCPFCATTAVGRADGPNAARPFYVCCPQAACPGYNPELGFVDPDLALQAWNRRAQLPPAYPNSAGHLFGFAKKNLIRGEMIVLTLDRTGLLTSDTVEFTAESKPLMLRPREC